MLHRLMLGHIDGAYSDRSDLPVKPVDTDCGFDLERMGMDQETIITIGIMALALAALIAFNLWGW